MGSHIGKVVVKVPGMTEQLTQTLAVNVSESDTDFTFAGGTFTLGEGPFTEQSFSAFDDDTEFSSLSTQPSESQGAAAQLGQLQDENGVQTAGGQISLVQVIFLTDPNTGQTIQVGRVRLTEDDVSFGNGAVLGEFFIFSGPIDPTVTYNVTEIEFSPGNGPDSSFQYSEFQNGSFASDGAVCFAAGTLIDTGTGRRPVQTLRRGDKVQTVDAGLRRILWCGHKFISPAAMARAEHLRPVIIASGAFGNADRLIVSQQHRIAVNDTFIRAKHLPHLPGVSARIARGIRQISYHHILLEDHHLLMANGVLAESLYLGPVAQKILSPSLARVADLWQLRHDRSSAGGLCRPLTRWGDIEGLRV